MDTNNQTLTVLNSINTNLIQMNELLQQAINTDYTPQVINGAILTSTTPNLTLNSNYIYSINFTLVGTVTSDVVVYLNAITNNNSQSSIKVNNSNSGYTITGYRLNGLSVPSIPSGVSLYVAYAGYTKD